MARDCSRDRGTVASDQFFFHLIQFWGQNFLKSTIHDFFGNLDEKLDSLCILKLRQCLRSKGRRRTGKAESREVKPWRAPLSTPLTSSLGRVYRHRGQRERKGRAGDRRVRNIERSSHWP